MQSLWLCLEGNSILTDTNIRSMKHYITKKFPTYTSARRATILANTVHRHINKYLPLLDEGSKGNLRARLLKTVYNQDNFRIVSLDIFRACLELSLGKKEIIEPLEQWLKLQGGERSAEEMAPFRQLIQEAMQSKFQDHILHIPEQEPIVSYRFKRYIALFLLILFLSVIINQSNQQSRTVKEVITPLSFMSDFESYTLLQKYPTVPVNELTSRYIYSQVDKDQLRKWLRKRDSLLADEPYLSTILATALQYNIHPFLLIAIAGQEQSLVPLSHKKAYLIGNNPFNVHHSWKEYNTDIADSTRIAAETILKLIKGRPEDIQPLEWINRKYAEDSNWHLGVEAFFNQMLLLKENSP